MKIFLLSLGPVEIVNKGMNTKIVRNFIWFHITNNILLTKMSFHALSIVYLAVCSAPDLSLWSFARALSNWLLQLHFPAFNATIIIKSYSVAKFFEIYHYILDNIFVILLFINPLKKKIYLNINWKYLLGN